MTESLELSIRNDQVASEQREFMVHVYKWMSMGLFLTATVAYIVSSSPALLHLIFGNSVIFYGLIIAEFILVVIFSAAVRKMSATQAMLSFLTYSALTGLTLAIIFIAYTSASIAVTFLTTAGTFGVMSIYGYITKKDLTSMGNICIMALIGLIIASLANRFMHSSALYWIITYAGILIFVGLTAFHTQKIKNIYLTANAGTDDDVKLSIYGALILYLDFINLFLSLLRIMGRRR